MIKRQVLKTTLAASLATVGLGLLAGTAQAQDFPTKPVRILTPFPVGSGPETVTRMVAEKLQRMWGKPVIVENKPGANGFIAIDAFKHGSKDGYDLIQLDNVHLVAYPSLFKKLPYDPANDFEQLAPLFRASFFFAVATNSPYKTVGDLIKDAKANPGKLNYGSWSIGNPVHLGSALFDSMAGTEMVHVVYKETSMLYTGVANGELAYALGSSASSGALQRGGKLRYIAIAGPKRNAAFPDVPTVAESGGPAGFEVTGWTTLAAPKGLDPKVAEKIRADIEKALAEPDIKERYVNFGYELFPTTKPEFAKFIETQAQGYSAVIKKAGASLD